MARSDLMPSRAPVLDSYISLTATISPPARRAFEANGLVAVIAEVDGKVPVGAVFYGGEAAPGLHRLFG